MAQTPDADPFAPWRACDPTALEAVFSLPTFDEQCFALLDLAPKTSARELSLLPWDETHEPRAFRNVRDAWANARAAKRENEQARDELPLDQVVREQFETAVRTRDMKGAEAALDVLVKLGTAKGVSKASKQQDDYSKLTDRQVLMLGALVHKMRGEPLTQVEQNLLAYVDLLDADDEPADGVAS